MSDAVEKLVEGDIFRWMYREPGDDRQWGRYHCCSRIAVVSGGMLRDTYWKIGNSFSEGRRFGIDDLPKLELTRLGNLADLERSPEYLADYYDDADFVNLNNANSPKGNFYLRKSAVRNQTKMLQAARYKLEQSEAAERAAADKSRQLHETIRRLESGDLTVYL